jgi:hypothetical protein
MEHRDSMLSREEAELEAEKLQEKVLQNATASDYEQANTGLSGDESVAVTSLESQQSVDDRLVELKAQLKEGREVIGPTEMYPITLDEVWMRLSPESASGTESDLITTGKKVFISWFAESPEYKKQQVARKRSLVSRLKNVFADTLFPTRDESEIVGFLIAHGVARNDADGMKWISTMLTEEFSAGGFDGNYRLEKFRNEHGEWCYRLKSEREYDDAD